MDQSQGFQAQSGGQTAQGGGKPLLDDGHPDQLLHVGSQNVSGSQNPPQQSAKQMPNISQMQGLRDAIEKAGAAFSQAPTQGGGAAIPPQPVSAQQPMQQVRTTPPPAQPLPQTPVLNQARSQSVGFPFSTKQSVTPPPPPPPSSQPVATQPPASQAVQPMSATRPQMQASQSVAPVQSAQSIQSVSSFPKPLQQSAQSQVPLTNTPKGLQIKPFAPTPSDFAPSFTTQSASTQKTQAASTAPVQPPVQNLQKTQVVSSLQPARPLVPKPPVQGGIDEKVRKFVDLRLEDEGFWGKNLGTSQVVWSYIKDRPAAEFTSGPLPTEDQAWEKYLNFELFTKAYAMIRDAAQKSGKQPQQGQTVITFLTAQKEVL